MPTNIIDGRADQVGPSAFSTVGAGLGQIGQLLAATMGAAAADKKAKAAAGAGMLDDAGYKAPGMDDLMVNNGGIAANPFAGGAGSGNLGVASLPSARPVDGMVQPFQSNPSGDFLSVGPSSQPPDLMKALQFNAPGGIAQTPIMSLLTRNRPNSLLQYGGL